MSVVGFLPFASLAAPGMTPTSAETPLGQSQSSVGDFLAGAENLLNPQPGSAACPSRDWLGQCQPSQPGNGSSPLGQSQSSVGDFLGISWARVATFILGFLLIMAGIFTHPAIREKAVEAGKVGAALAA